MRRGAGVEGVLDQFLDDARRPLDDLAGGDLVDHGFGKLADGHGATIGGFGSGGAVTGAFSRSLWKREGFAPLLTQAMAQARLSCGIGALFLR